LIWHLGTIWGVIRRPLPLVLACLVASLAACGSSDSPPTIPSTDDAVTTSTLAAATTVTTLDQSRLSLEQATLEFTACMRDNGIDFPDIRIDADGRPDLGNILDQIDTTTSEFRQALTRCAGILTRAGALELTSDPELQAVIIDQLATFSECMRTNGVDDFPDPSPGFNGTGSPYPLGLIPLDDPDFQTAVTTCQDQLGSFGLEG
jgi:hypothetical protein